LNRLSDYLSHILEAILRIQRYTEGIDQAAFMASQITQDAVVRNIEIIGEAGRNIRKHYPEFTAANPQLRLDDAYAMRNAVTHGYFAVRYNIVWTTLRSALPVLRTDVEALINDLE
jgi:uncharacterized protein with HEPN domain